jgi:hypothetical protein
MKLILKMVAATALLGAAQAYATIIDFGAAPWTPGADNLATYTVGNVTATAGPLGKLIFAEDPQDGLGIHSGEDDEIDGMEYLTISFANAVTLKSIKLTDFFPKVHDGLTNDGSSATGEEGHISLWLGWAQVGATIDIHGVNSSGPNGEQTVAFAGQTVNKIVFWAQGARDEYSVKSIEVPEPGLLGLLGFGMFCLGLSRRRQAKAA